MTSQDNPDSRQSNLKAAFLPHDETPAASAHVFGDDDSAIYRTLLESTKAIPWKSTGRRWNLLYIGPQIDALLGWPPSSWKNVNDWAERTHPIDHAGIGGEAFKSHSR